MSEKMKQLREQIGKVDDELLKLANQRAALAQQIGHLKEDGVVLRPEREAQVLQRLMDNNSGPLSNAAVARLFTEVISQCRAGSPADDRLSRTARDLHRSCGSETLWQRDTGAVVHDDRRGVSCGGE